MTHVMTRPPWHGRTRLYVRVAETRTNHHLVLHVSDGGFAGYAFERAPSSQHGALASVDAEEVNLHTLSKACGDDRRSRQGRGVRVDEPVAEAAVDSHLQPAGSLESPTPRTQRRVLTEA